jgi:hypothetical protein
MLADVEHPRDVGVGHAPGELHFAPKALEHGGSIDQVGAQELERDNFVELHVSRAIHGAHRSGPDQRENLVAAAHERFRCE